LMWARTHWPASQPGVLQLPGMAVTGLPALSTEQAVLSVIGMCWVTHTPASQPGVCRHRGWPLNGVAGGVGRAGRAVRHVDVRANTHTRLAAGGLQLPGMAVTGFPAVSAEQAVLSVTLMWARTHWPASQPGSYSSQGWP